MKLNELTPSVPKKNRKRIGRGNSSGWGKTAGKGSNGQNSRAGGGVKPYFEGGQMPIYRRVPKRGFSNAIFKKEYTVNPHSKKEYDMIFVSISQGKIANVMEILRKEAFKGTILLCCNLWYDKQYLDKIMQGYVYILGFPVAGGCIKIKK